MIRESLFVLASIATVSSANIAITELSTKSAVDPEDYFELTNFGATDFDISGWSFDDESADFADAAAFNGISTIAAGESVILFQLDEQDMLDPAYDPAGEVALFRSYWGGLAGVQVGFYAGAGLGKGDAITIFDAMGDIALSLEYGMTDPNQTHAGDWAAGNIDGSDIYENDAAIWVPGSDGDFALAADGVYGSFQNIEGEWGSPGVVPAPGAAALLGLGGLVASRRRRS